MVTMRTISGASRLVAGLTAAAVVGALTACSAAPIEARESERAAAENAEPQPLRLVASEDGEATQVVASGSAETAALAASRTLFETAPVVVTVTPSDTDAVASAAQVAGERGLPVLPAPGEGTDVADEIDRLGVVAVLAVDEAAATATSATLAASAVKVFTDAADLPDVRRAEPQPTTAVLTTGAETDGLAMATAAAAGATVATVPSGDPRGSAEAVTTLAAAKPTRILALGDAFGTAETLAPRVASSSTGAQLPGGGQLVLADRRYVALYGHPGTPSLGVLGEQPLDAAVVRAQKLGRTYAKVSDLPVVPTFEIIATVASGGAGPDGNYSNEVDPAALEPWVKAAGEQGVYVVLDLQPGTTDFLTQAKRYESLLAYPHVGLALDPEWRLRRGQRHMAQIGSVTAAEVNATSAWLAAFTRSQALPQKMLVLHQFTTSMISERETLDTSHDELAVVIHADGHGGRGAKTATWNKLRENAPPGVVFAWKNFVDEDRPTYTPAETMAIEPTPVLVSYQ